MKHLKLFFAFCVMAFTNMQAQEQFTVYFDFDVDEANESSNDKLSKWIRENPNVSVNKIHGYTDSVGEAIYNTDLSERRAAYVYEQLKNSGVVVDGAELKGFGETRATGKSNKDRKVVLYYDLKKFLAVDPVPVKPESVKPETVKPEPVSDFMQKVNVAEKGDKIKIPNLNFYNNSEIILPESQPVLNELLAIMRSKPSLKIDIQGHICCLVKEEKHISQRRAETVYKFLKDNGIDKSRLSYQSFGSTKPIYVLPEKSEAEKAANRRVEIEIVEN